MFEKRGTDFNVHCYKTKRQFSNYPQELSPTLTCYSLIEMILIEHKQMDMQLANRHHKT